MTLHEIAYKAEVSIGTVDRVLHNRGRVSAATREKIEAIVAESGYRPNPIARHLKLNRIYTFAAILPGLADDSGYWQIARGGIEKAARELEAFGVRVERIECDRNASPELLASIAARLGEPGFDGLLIAPVQPDASSGLLGALPADFPVVFFDAQLPGFSPLSRIGQDAFQSGVVAGRLLEAFSAGKGPYFVVSAHGEDYHIRRRIDGFFRYFAGRRGGGPAIRLLEFPDLERKERREAFLEAAFGEAGRPGGIFVTGASVHGVASFANAAGKERVAVVGYDLVPENERLLRAGLIDCIISQRPDSQAYEGIYQLYRRVLLQQPVEEEITVPIDIYVRENLPDTRR